MMSADVKANIKQQKIKDLVAYILQSCPLRTRGWVFFLTNIQKFPHALGIFCIFKWLENKNNFSEKRFSRIQIQYGRDD